MPPYISGALSRRTGPACCWYKEAYVCETKNENSKLLKLKKFCMYCETSAEPTKGLPNSGSPSSNLRKLYPGDSGKHFHPPNRSVDIPTGISAIDNRRTVAQAECRAHTSPLMMPSATESSWDATWKEALQYKSSGFEPSKDPRDSNAEDAAA